LQKSLLRPRGAQARVTNYAVTQLFHALLAVSAAVTAALVLVAASETISPRGMR
jgi:hypothetical protein